MRETSTHIYFFSGKDFLSNFYSCSFTLNGITYSCVEQYIMAQKALLFNDKYSFDFIMSCELPIRMKTAGRNIENFSEKVWLKHRNEILFDGLMGKFSQNPILKRKILLTEKKILVEASPYDKIYGVGLGENDDLILDETNWSGYNLLGKTLMDVRSKLT